MIPLTAVSLAELRRHRGLTQADLALRLAWSQSQVSRFEHTTDHRISTVDAYLRALDGVLVVGAMFADSNDYLRVRL